MLRRPIALVLALLFGCDESTRSPIEKVTPGEGVELLPNGSFNDGISAPWMEYFGAPASGSSGLENGQLCLTVGSAGVNEWDAQLRARGVSLPQGHRITVRIDLSASPPTTVSLKLAMQAAPYTQYWDARIAAGSTATTLERTFTMSGASDGSAELAVMVGGSLAPKTPLKLCIDNVSVRDADQAPGTLPGAEPTPRSVHLNQLGFRPRGGKLAVWQTPSSQVTPFEVRDAGGQVLFEGSSLPHGSDFASGDTVQWLDFGALTTPCEECRLTVAGAESAPFRIAEDVFDALAKHALGYFYHNRSGTPITLPYVEGAQWTRAAGHLGDGDVGCHASGPCDYRLNALGGWYDAGDHGKYLVNGGLALFMLQNLYERQSVRGVSVFGDGALSIPEQANGVPDILDEARWEADFFLRMQVPNGELSGLAHHKLHGETWTALGTAPADDTQPRYLYPPSTAATLNLAATAAQSARLLAPYDGAFAERALVVAERAYAAAKAHPALYAPNVSVGGGPYDDTFVDDEFVWAATELWLTTKKDEYLSASRASPLFAAMPSLVPAPRSDQGHYRALTWQNVEALASFSLLLHLDRLSAEDADLARNNLFQAADAFSSLLDSEGYAIPMAAGQDGSYLWGSNAIVLSNAVVCAYAHDLSPEPRYRRCVENALAYVLGQNALDRSYVTAVGERPARFPHHRFWAHSVRSDRPPPPPGALVSGANSALADPAVKASVASGSAPQRCYVDDIEAYSVNEVAVHDNSLLAWVSSYLASIE